MSFVCVDISVGVVQGGILTQTLSNIDIQCFPTDVPENIIVDITELDLNGSISAGDLKLDENINIPALKRGESVLMAHSDTEIHDEDHLIVFYKDKEVIDNFYNTFR